jgi:CHAT domain-containing protein
VTWVDIVPERNAADPGGEHWVCLVRHTGEPAWIRLNGTGPDGSWTEADVRMTAGMRKTFVRSSTHPAMAWKDLARKLAAQRLAPVIDHLRVATGLSGVNSLIILPAWDLNGIPIEVLVAASDTPTPKPTISYAPSATMFAWLREHRRSGRPRDLRGPRLLALGDPAYVQSSDRDPLLAAVRGEGLTPLPGTRREVESLAALFDLRTVRLGSEASEQELDRLAGSGELRSFDIIHLATHGQMDPEVALRSRIFLASDRLPNPLSQVLSGRSLYDGELTAEQIRRTWKLDADLVTLSACETALGRPSGGEGYLGFSQALLLSGAHSLLLSQWKVDDRATALLMTRFYQNLLGKRPELTKPMPKAEALREAKTWLRGLSGDQDELAMQGIERGSVRRLPAGARQPAALQGEEKGIYDHPYYWAAFVLIGDSD